MPAIRTGCRSGSAAGRRVRTSAALELRAQHLERVLAEGDPGRGVVGDDPLPGVERAQVGRRGERRAAAPAARARPRTRSPPRATPSRQSSSRRGAAPRGEAERLAGAGPGEPLEPVAADPRARGEVGEVAVGAAALALGDQRRGLLLADALDVAEADADGELAVRRAARPCTRPRSRSRPRARTSIPRRCASWASASGG